MNGHGHEWNGIKYFIFDCLLKTGSMSIQLVSRLVGMLGSIRRVISSRAGRHKLSILWWQFPFFLIHKWSKVWFTFAASWRLWRILSNRTFPRGLLLLASKTCLSTILLNSWCRLSWLLRRNKVREQQHFILLALRSLESSWVHCRAFAICRRSGLLVAMNRLRGTSTKGVWFLRRFWSLCAISNTINCSSLSSFLIYFIALMTSH